MKLTNEVIAKAARPATGQKFLWDTLVSGLGVRLVPHGDPAFVAQYRQQDGKKKRVTIGHFPRLSATDARTKAKEILSANETRKSRPGSGAPLHAEMTAWADRVAVLKNWRPRYTSKVRSLIASYIAGEPNPRLALSTATVAAVEALGTTPTADVTRLQVMAVVEKIRPGAGEQLMAIISSFYTWKIVSGATLTNPASHRLAVTGGRRVRSRLLTDRELLALLGAHEGEGDPAGAAFLLLALTGCRRREITHLRWTEVDLEAGTLTLPAERRKSGKRDPLPFVITLHPMAVAAIARQPVLEGNPYVFWGRRDKRPFDFQHSLIDRLRETVPVADWRYHDLRRWFRSTLSKLGVPQIVAELCLNHAGQSQLEQVYNRHSYDEEKARAWRQLGDYLVELRQ